MPASNDVDKALQLLMGDFIRKKPYMMMSSNPEEGDVAVSYTHLTLPTSDLV